MDSRDSVHGQLASRQKYHGGRVQCPKAAPFTAARNQGNSATEEGARDQSYIPISHFHHPPCHPSVLHKLPGQSPKPVKLMLSSNHHTFLNTKWKKWFQNSPVLVCEGPVSRCSEKEWRSRYPWFQSANSSEPSSSFLHMRKSVEILSTHTSGNQLHLTSNVLAPHPDLHPPNYKKWISVAYKSLTLCCYSSSSGLR